MKKATFNDKTQNSTTSMVSKSNIYEIMYRYNALQTATIGYLFLLSSIMIASNARYFNCTGSRACTIIMCLDNTDCFVDCIGDEACKWADIHCGDNSTCTVNCTGNHACTDTNICFGVDYRPCSFLHEC